MTEFKKLNLTEKLNLKELEHFRIEKAKIINAEYKKLKYIFYISVIALIVFMFFFFDIHGKKNLFYIGGFMMPSVVYFFFFMSSTEDEYETKFKNEILSRLVTLIDENIQYVPDKEMDREEFDESGFIKEKHTFESEEYFNGTIHNRPFISSEIKVNTATTKNAKGGGTHLFQGMYFAVEFNFPNDLIIDVLPDDISFLGKLGTTLQKINPYREALVKFENPEFEKMYVVYSNVPELCQTLLNYDFQSFLMKISNEYESPVFLCIRNGKIHCGLDTHENMFEIDHDESLLNEETLEIHYDHVKMYFNFIKEVVVKMEGKTRLIK